MEDVPSGRCILLDTSSPDVNVVKKTSLEECKKHCLASVGMSNGDCWALEYNNNICTYVISFYPFAYEPTELNTPRTCFASNRRCFNGSILIQHLYIC